MHRIIHVSLLLLLMHLLPAQNVVEYTFRVDGVCGMCKDRIENIALTEGKASTAHWDLDTKIMTVTLDEEDTQVTAIKWHLAQAGHDNGDFTAPDDVYAALHHCCKYRPEDGASHEAEEGRSPYVDQVDGYVHAMSDGQKIPLIGANVTLEGAGGIGTNTDDQGYFTIDNPEKYGAIIISYIGYEDQTVLLKENYLEVTLADGHTLEAVEITYRKKSTEISFVNTLNVESITRDELYKAACCNLSESFETNPSVDVSFNDAVTGTKQIQMLGLAGPYVQITRELLPDVRGLNSLYGLTSAPGPWIESIQLIKGIGSVVNGHESITGQINVELKKPDLGERLHVNGFVNNAGRVELNSNLRLDVTDNIATSLLVHGRQMSEAHDNNGDGFTDMPIENNLVLANRWKFNRKKNFVGQLGVKVSRLRQEGGFHDHFSGKDVDHERHWRMYSEVDRNEVWGKLGYLNPDNPNFSIGLQLSASDHRQDARFGRDDYDAEQQNLYGNLIVQNIFENGHTMRAGLSYQQDDVVEEITKADRYVRAERVPGAYVEYTLMGKDEKWSIIPGLRVDHHNNYGSFVTPRLHAKYNFSDRSVIRFTGGKGWRTANIFAENIGLFATSRTVEVLGDGTADTPYGLQAEEAWNYGLSFTKGIDVADRELIFSIDGFRTEFSNQIIVDWENARKVSFYNLQGNSYANSLQAKIDYEIAPDLDVRVAYRLFDVQATYNEGELVSPLISRHRAFINVAYQTKSDWHFDLTWNWRGSARLPDTSVNPDNYRRADDTPSFGLLSGQIMKRLKGGQWDIYLGGENLLNYKQQDAIIASDDAFGQFFDGSLVWAPLFGTRVHLGFRFNIPQGS